MRTVLISMAALLAGLALGRWSAPSEEAAPLVPRQAYAPEATRRVPPEAASPSACITALAELASEPGSPAEAPPVPTLRESKEALARTHDPQLKTQLIRDITARMAQDDLRSAWGWLAQHQADPGYAENARNLLYQWSYAKPEDVAALLPQLSSGEAQTAAAHQLAQLWNKKDPDAYHAWVASLPEGPLKAAANSPY